MSFYEKKLSVSQVRVTNTSGSAYVQGQLVMEQGFFGNVVNTEGIANGAEGIIDTNSERIIETDQTKAGDTFAESVNGNPSSVYFDRTNAYLTDTDAAGLVEVGFITDGGAADSNDVIRFKPLPQVPLEGSVPPGSIDTADIADDAVTNDKLNNIAQGSVKVGGALNAPTDLDASGDGEILVGDGTDVNAVAVSGDIALTNAGVTTIANDAVSSAKLAEDTIQSVTVSITAAEIKALRATPKELVPAPGANKQIQLIGGLIKLTAGSEVLTESDDNLAIEYDDGAAAACSETIESTGFIDQSADTVSNTIPIKDVIDASADVENKNIALANTGSAEIAGNASDDAVLTVKLSYRIVDFS